MINGQMHYFQCYIYEPCHKTRDAKHVAYPENTNGWRDGYCEQCGKQCICSRLVDMRNETHTNAIASAVEAVVGCDDYPNGDNMLLVDAYRLGLENAREAIEALTKQ